MSKRSEEDYDVTDLGVRKEVGLKDWTLYQIVKIEKLIFVSLDPPLITFSFFFDRKVLM